MNEHEATHLEQLAAELDSFGGGSSVQLSRHKVVVWVKASPARNILRQEGTQLRLRDPKAPDVNDSSAERCFKVPSCVFAELDAFQIGLNEELCKDVCSSLMSGFNHTVMSMGQTQLGKSTCLFGKFAWPASQMRGPCCTLTAILRRLLSRESSDQGKLQIALSCWEVACEQVVDLLAVDEPCSQGRRHPSARPRSTPSRVAVPGTPGLALEHTAVRIESLVDADKVLAFARTRSVSWGECKSPPGLVTALPNRGHSFVRIIVTDRSNNRFSMLHIVDLAGSQPLGGHRIASLFAPPASLQPNSDSSRHISKDLLSVSRMLTHIASASSNSASPRAAAASGQRSGAAAASGMHATVTTGNTTADSSSSHPPPRDTKLAQVLHPLIAGNCRVTLLAAVSADSGSFLDTSNTLRLACRMQNVTTRMAHNQGAELVLLPLSQALPADALEVAHRVQRAHMHLHAAGEESDEDETICHGATAVAQVTSAAPEATPVTSTDAAPLGTLDVESYTYMNDACAPSQHNEHTHDNKTPEGMEGVKQELLANGKAVAGCESTNCGTGQALLSASDSANCMEKRPQECSEASERTASVQHFLAHMEDLVGGLDARRAEAQRSSLQMMATIGTPTTISNLQPRPAARGQGLHPDSLMKGSGSENAAAYALDVTGNSTGVQDTKDARDYRKQFEHAMAALDLDSPGHLHSEYTEGTAMSSPRRSSPSISPLPNCSTPPADMSTLVSPGLADATNSATEPLSQPHPVSIQSPNSPLTAPQPPSSASHHHSAPTRPLQQPMQFPSPSKTQREMVGAQATPMHENTPPRLHHAVELAPRRSVGTHGSPEPLANMQEGMQHPVWHGGSYASQHGNSEPQNQVLELRDQAGREEMRWMPPVELETATCSYRITSSSPQSAGSPRPIRASRKMQPLVGSDPHSIPPNHRAASSVSPILRVAHALQDSINMPHPMSPPNTAPSTISAYKGHKKEGTQVLQGQAAAQAALDRERQRSSLIDQRCKALEQDLEECAMDYEVKLDNEKIRRMEVQRALHAMQQGSDMAAVFARYEHDLERLRKNNDQLRAQNDTLAKAQVGCESPEQPGFRDTPPAGSGGCKGSNTTQECPETGMPREQRISALKRQARRARLERDAAVEASEGYRKKERLYALREKQAELALNRVQAAEKEHSQQEKLLAHKGKALMQSQADLADSRSKCSRMETHLEDLRNKAAGQELELQSIRKQLQEKQVPRSPFKDAAVLEALPRLPHSLVTVSATILSPKQTQTSMQCLLHLAQKLKQEPLSVPTQKLVDKLVLAAQSVAKEESIRKLREEILVTFVREHHSLAHAR